MRHRARRRDNGEWVEGEYVLVANTYHIICPDGAGVYNWEEIDVKTLEEIK